MSKYFFVNFSLNMLFWDNGDSVRLENTKFCWFKAKELNLFLNNNGIESRCNLFDFSKEKNIDDSIHIPLNELYYQRSKKINYALNYPENNSDVFAIIDSDCYFHKSYFDEFKQDIITSFKDNVVLTYQLIDIPLNKRYQFIDFNLNLEKFDNVESNINKGDFIYRHSAGFGTMGGFFICGTKALRDVGGFNEQFLTWGAEDDEALMRIKNKQGWYTKHNKGPLHLGHSKNLEDPYYHIPVYSDKYYEVNNVKFGRKYDS